MDRAPVSMQRHPQPGQWLFGHDITLFLCVRVLPSLLMPSPRLLLKCCFSILLLCSAAQAQPAQNQVQRGGHRAPHRPGPPPPTRMHASCPHRLGLLVVNEPDQERRRRLQRVLAEFLPHNLVSGSSPAAAHGSSASAVGAAAGGGAASVSSTSGSLGVGAAGAAAIEGVAQARRRGAVGVVRVTGHEAEKVRGWWASGVAVRGMWVRVTGHAADTSGAGVQVVLPRVVLPRLVLSRVVLSRLGSECGEVGGPDVRARGEVRWDVGRRCQLGLASPCLAPGTTSRGLERCSSMPTMPTTSRPLPLRSTGRGTSQSATTACCWTCPVPASAM